MCARRDRGRLQWTWVGYVLVVLYDVMVVDPCVKKQTPLVYSNCYGGRSTIQFVDYKTSQTICPYSTVKRKPCKLRFNSAIICCVWTLYSFIYTRKHCYLWFRNIIRNVLSWEVSWWKVSYKITTPTHLHPFSLFSAVYRSLWDQTCLVQNTTADVLVLAKAKKRCGWFRRP